MSLKSYLVTVFAQPINNNGGCILVARFFYSFSLISNGCSTFCISHYGVDIVVSLFDIRFVWFGHLLVLTLSIFWWCLVVSAFELMLIVDIGHIRYDEGIYPESNVRLGFGYLIALCSPAISVPTFQVLLCIVDISHLRHHTFLFE